jgi:hypothetical protein
MGDALQLGFLYQDVPLPFFRFPETLSKFSRICFDLKISECFHCFVKKALPGLGEPSFFSLFLFL